MQPAEDVVSTPTKEFDMQSIAQGTDTVHHEKWCKVEHCDVLDGDVIHHSPASELNYQQAFGEMSLTGYAISDGTMPSHKDARITLALEHRECEESISVDLSPVDALCLASELVAHAVALMPGGFLSVESGTRWVA
ncbi:hypothetical protein CUD01_18370 [Cellulomonas uda]|uniref:Uncharacterized protein n=2 Tax=Cellulomonas uda TaxID=1714 RepID=A0A4Y3KBK6_CELUD|nr:hypothetical protein CUD01_18370 [Cellulomonas uda]